MRWAFFSDEPLSLPGQRFFSGEGDEMPAVSLICKECREEHELGASYVCERCFGPLEVKYDYSELDDPAALRRKIQAGPPSIWRYSDFLPFEGRPKTGL